MSRTALDTYTLLGVKQQQKKFNPFFTLLFFSSTIEFDTPEILFDKVKKGVELAPFVAPMVSGKANRKKGGILKSLQPAYLKPTDNVDPKMLLKRRPGENLGGSLSPVERRLAVIAELLTQQEESIQHREEWMAVSAVMTGKVIVEGEDYETQEVDYGRSTDNNIALAGGAKWDAVDAATYDPTTDIEDWAERASGTVGRLIFDKYGWRKFHSFKAVRDKLDTTQRGSTSSLQLGPQLQKEVMFKGYFGEYEVWVYVGKFTEKGVDKYFMPANSLLLAPLSTDNVMGYGAIQDAEANADGVVAVSRYPSNWFSKNPSVEWMQTQSAPLPILLDADEFVAITLF